ncbi:MAG: hypothetical protein U0P45_06670 [Acidimicrobiales bacterium]
MSMFDRIRPKHQASAQKLLPDARVRTYAVARDGLNPVIVVLAMVGTAVAFSVGLVILTGQFVIIGLVPMLIVQYFASPPRGVAVADQGIAVLRRSFWTGKPNKVIAVVGHGYTQPTEESLGRVLVKIGNEELWMAKGEEAVIRQALATPYATPPTAGYAAPSMPQPPMPPMPPQPPSPPGPPSA